jgi:hypothetical protein
MITLTLAAGLTITPDIRRPPPPPPRDLEHPTQREMQDPSWRPFLRWGWCTDAKGVRFRCQQ